MEGSGIHGSRPRVPVVVVGEVVSVSHGGVRRALHFMLLLVPNHIQAIPCTHVKAIPAVHAVEAVSK